MSEGTFVQCLSSAGGKVPFPLSRAVSAVLSLGQDHFFEAKLVFTDEPTNDVWERWANPNAKIEYTLEMVNEVHVIFVHCIERLTDNGSDPLLPTDAVDLFSKSSDGNLNTLSKIILRRALAEMPLSAYRVASVLLWYMALMRSSNNDNFQENRERLAPLLCGKPMKDCIEKILKVREEFFWHVEDTYLNLDMNNLQRMATQMDHSQKVVWQRDPEAPPSRRVTSAETEDKHETPEKDQESALKPMNLEIETSHEFTYSCPGSHKKLKRRQVEVITPRDIGGKMSSSRSLEVIPDALSPDLRHAKHDGQSRKSDVMPSSGSEVSLGPLAVEDEVRDVSMDSLKGRKHKKRAVAQKDIDTQTAPILELVETPAEGQKSKRIDLEMEMSHEYTLLSPKKSKNRQVEVEAPGAFKRVAGGGPLIVSRSLELITDTAMQGSHRDAHEGQSRKSDVMPSNGSEVSQDPSEVEDRADSPKGKKRKKRSGKHDQTSVPKVALELSPLEIFVASPSNHLESDIENTDAVKRPVDVVLELSPLEIFVASPSNHLESDTRTPPLELSTPQGFTISNSSDSDSVSSDSDADTRETRKTRRHRHLRRRMTTSEVSVQNTENDVSTTVDISGNMAVGVERTVTLALTEVTKSRRRKKRRKTTSDMCVQTHEVGLWFGMGLDMELAIEGAFRAVASAFDEAAALEEEVGSARDGGEKRAENDGAVLQEQEVNNIPNPEGEIRKDTESQHETSPKKEESEGKEESNGVEVKKMEEGSPEKEGTGEADEGETEDGGKEPEAINDEVRESGENEGAKKESSDSEGKKSESSGEQKKEGSENEEEKSESSDNEEEKKESSENDERNDESGGKEENNTESGQSEEKKETSENEEKKSELSDNEEQKKESSENEEEEKKESSENEEEKKVSSDNEEEKKESSDDDEEKKESSENMEKKSESSDNEEEKKESSDNEEEEKKESSDNEEEEEKKESSDNEEEKKESSESEEGDKESSENEEEEKKESSENEEKKSESSDDEEQNKESSDNEEEKKESSENEEEEKKESSDNEEEKKESSENEEEKESSDNDEKKSESSDSEQDKNDSSENEDDDKKHNKESSDNEEEAKEKTDSSAEAQNESDSNDNGKGTSPSAWNRPNNSSLLGLMVSLRELTDQNLAHLDSKPKPPLHIPPPPAEQPPPPGPPPGTDQTESQGKHRRRHKKSSEDGGKHRRRKKSSEDGGKHRKHRHHHKKEEDAPEEEPQVMPQLYPEAIVPVTVPTASRRGGARRPPSNATRP